MRNFFKKKIVFLTLICLMLPIAVFGEASKPSSQVYFLLVDFDKGNFSVRESSLMSGKAPDRNSQPEGGFRCDVVSVNDEILDSFLFEIPNVTCSDIFGADGKLSGGCVQNESGSFSLQISYQPAGRNINLYDPSGKMVLNADISGLADLCGDGICQENENRGSCAKDCKSGIRDTFCDRVSDGTCDPDCPAGDDADCEESKNKVSLILPVALIILTVAAAGFVFYRRKRGEAGSFVDDQH